MTAKRVLVPKLAFRLQPAILRSFQALAQDSTLKEICVRRKYSASELLVRTKTQAIKQDGVFEQLQRLTPD